MSWVRLDDGVWAHPKLLAVPRATRWAWVAGLAYSSAYHREGRLAHSELRPIGASARDAGALVLAGLWVPEDGGWRIHDYGDYQPVNGEPLPQARRGRTQRSEGAMANVMANAIQRPVATTMASDGSRAAARARRRTRTRIYLSLGSWSRA